MARQPQPSPTDGDVVDDPREDDAADGEDFDAFRRWLESNEAESSGPAPAPAAAAPEVPAVAPEVPAAAPEVPPLPVPAAETSARAPSASGSSDPAKCRVCKKVLPCNLAQILSKIVRVTTPFIVECVDEILWIQASSTSKVLEPFSYESLSCSHHPLLSRRLLQSH